MNVPDCNKYRLVTRSDFDGLVCAVLLKELNMIDDILFVHPKDMQDGRIAISRRDITTNLPYVPEARIVFDNNPLAAAHDECVRSNHVLNPISPSAARVVYEYYGGKQAFPNISEDMMEAVDKSGSADYTIDDILNPQRWVLLSYLLDGRTGLGSFKTFRIPNYQLMMDLIDYGRRHPIDAILQLPDVQERIAIYQEHAPLAHEQILRCCRVYDNLVVLDLRDEPTIYAANRFLIYALFPDCNISIHAMWGEQRINTVFATGKSIINRSAKTHIGELMQRYGGGGHENAGTCQIANDQADQVLRELILQITTDG